MVKYISKGSCLQPPDKEGQTHGTPRARIGRQGHSRTHVAGVTQRRRAVPHHVPASVTALRESRW